MTDNENKEKKEASSDNNSGKLRIAAIGAAATLVTALISALVSLMTIEIDRWRARSEDSIQRAELFKELMESVTTEGKAGFAILALWKLYEKDRKLVVISALQSEDPKALTVLHHLGLEKELAGYEPTIRNVIDKVDDDRRSELLQLYSEIDPRGLVDLTVEEILDDPPTTFSQSQIFDELSNLIRDKPEFRTHIASRISSDQRIKESIRSRFALALALYLAGETEPFDQMIVESEEDTEFFGELAPLINAGWQKVRYEVRDWERLLLLAVKLMRASGGKKDREGQFFYALEIFRNALPQSGLASSEEPEILEMFEDQFRIIPSDRLTRERILDTVLSLDKEVARKLYSYAVGCEDASVSRKFYATVHASSKDFVNLRDPDFETTRGLGQAFLNNNGLSCEAWRVK